MALSGDGNIALIGGPADNGDTGATWVFGQRTNCIPHPVFEQLGAKLVGTGAAGHAQQGYSVALSFTGATALIGGPYDDNSAGAAWVFA